LEYLAQHDPDETTKHVAALSADLLDRLAADPAIGMTRAEIDEALDVRQFVGRAPQQVDEFLREDVTPILDRHRDRLGAASDVRV